MQKQVSRLAFLGFGSMAGAILQGFLREADTALETVQATCKSAQSAAKYQGMAGVNVVSLADNPNANREAVQNAQVVVLGVKPWLIVETLQEIAAVLPKNAVVISVAAGITLRAMRQALADRADVKLVRAMPNTPAFIGKGVTGIAGESNIVAGDAAAGAETTSEANSSEVSKGAENSPEMQIAQEVFSAVGEVLVVPETKIDALSTVSGSGPAYLFWFVEQFMSAAERLGFSEKEAELLAQNTVIGAAQLLEQSENTAAELRKAVTSPNGTTEQALKAFNASDPEKMFDTALNAALKRAKELAAQ